MGLLTTTATSGQSHCLSQAQHLLTILKSTLFMLSNILAYCWTSVSLFSTLAILINTPVSLLVIYSLALYCICIVFVSVVSECDSKEERRQKTVGLFTVTFHLLVRLMT